MPVFAVTAPHLSPDQHYDLEDRLVALPGVDAFFNEEGALGTEVTAQVADLPAVMAVIYAWAADFERGESLVQVSCGGGSVRALAEADLEEIVAFLATCGDDAAALQGLTKRLADDGMHAGR